MRKLFGILLVTLVTAATGVANAQEPAPKAPAPAPPSLTPAERLARQASAYERIFADAKRQAQAGCKKAGGKLTVTVDSAARVTISCTM